MVDFFSLDNGTEADILFILHLGTGVSFLGAIIIIMTYLAASALHQKRALGHIVVKSVAIVIMVIGYWLDLFLPDSSCNHPTFCAIQFCLLQIGNCGILLSEAAMSLEIYVLSKHFRANTLDVMLANGIPIQIKAVYIFFILLAIISISSGLSQYLQNYNKGLYCYLDSWCWYLDPWSVFVFKFGWIIMIISFGISNIIYLTYVMNLVTNDIRLKQVTGRIAIMLRNLVICHIFAWGVTFIWRIGRSMSSPPSWATSSKSIIVLIVVFNAAGAGYLDVMVWLSFPDLQKEYSMKRMKERYVYFRANMLGERTEQESSHKNSVIQSEETSMDTEMSRSDISRE